MIPSILLTVLPLPSALLLLILTLYHLTPLLTLFSNLTPSLQKLSTIIPHPRRARNLPREFFNLPPRPGSPSTESKKDLGGAGARLGVRGKLMLLLIGEGIVSLACGWAALASGVEGGMWAAVGASVTLLPGTVAWLAVFAMLSRPAHYARHTTTRLSAARLAIFKSGGISHATLYSRVLPLSSGTTGLGGVLAGALGDKGRYVVLAWSGVSVAVLVGCAGAGMWRMVYTPREGMIRLRGESRMSMYEKEEQEGREEMEVEEAVDEGEIEGLRRTDSWVSSPSRRHTIVSSFEFSPSTQAASSYKTPRSKPSSSNLNTPHTQSQSVMSPSSFQHLSPNPQNSSSGNEDSWLSHDTNSQSTISEWSFPSPVPAITRPQSPASPVDVNLPQPGPSQAGGVKASDSTMYTQTLTSTPGSAIRSPDGSVIAAYSPDPYHPMPRGFESLTSYPLSPSQMAESRVSLASRGITSATGIAVVPVERVSAKGSSTWTLQSYHSSGGDPASSGTTLAQSQEAFKTPDAKTRRSMVDHRAPPPPPMPVDMPLPPTPTFARNSTLWELSSGGAPGKDSMDMLMSAEEREWVKVDSGVEGLQGWGKGGRRGVGMVAVAGSVVCWALSIPMLLQGPTTIATVLYLISILLPAPILALTSHLIRCRSIAKPGPARGKKGSTQTTTTAGTGHKSLALMSESQLSLPCSISPKLSPPAPKRASTMDAGSSTRLGKLVQQKPSLTTFLSADDATSRPGGPSFQSRSPERRHTVYGNLTMKDLEAEDAMRRTLARRSGDVWIQNGHAIEGGGIISRAAEMFKPVPAMRVMDSQRPQGSGERDLRVMKRMRGGVVSMLAKRASRLFESDAQNAEESFDMAEYDQERAEAGCASPGRSSIAISVTQPSPDRRMSRFSRVSSNGEGDTTVAAAQIHRATRGRMSTGPTLIFGKTAAAAEEQDREGREGYELDWLTAGVLPSLVPTIKIGKDVKVEPAPHSAPLPEAAHGDARTKPRPLSEQTTAEGDTSYASMPSFHAVSFMDQSTPQQSRQPGRRHGHTRSYSSSVDFTHSPEYYTAETATSASREVRRKNAEEAEERDADGQVLNHKVSFGLPRLQKEDFTEDLRKSFDELSRPSAAEYDSAGGIDLPPIPNNLARRSALSPVTERTEDRTGSDSSMVLSKSCMEDMHLALQLGASPSARSLAADPLSPPMPGYAYHDIPLGNSSLANSMNTDAEEAVEEMERMMAMDTPTRAEFVISPPPSSYAAASGRTSQASDRSATTSMSGTTTTSTCMSAVGYDGLPDDAPPVPDLPSPYRQPAYPPAVLSHPHPPPLSHSASASTFGPINTNRFSVQEPHPPLHRLLPKKSTETMHSTWTASESEVSMPTPPPRVPEFKPSNAELRRVKELSERNADREEVVEKGRSQSAMGYRKDKPNEVAARKGLKPLRLVADRQANRLSMPMPTSMTVGQKVKKFEVLLEGEAGSKVSLGAKSAKGKENERTGKMSSGSGVSGVRGLRV
ncbi:hypothetical protein IAT38_006065 [Cryptococcus sp. DSM 104549]